MPDAFAKRICSAFMVPLLPLPSRPSFACATLTMDRAVMLGPTVGGLVARCSPDELSLHEDYTMKI